LQFSCVYEQERDVVTQVFLTAAGHAQERSLLGDVLDSVQGGDSWIADRNFRTLGFLLGLARADATGTYRPNAFWTTSVNDTLEALVL
jgi:hypothetical protein